MTAEQQVPTPSPLGPVARYEQSIIDRITTSTDPRQEWRRLVSELLAPSSWSLARPAGHDGQASPA